MPCRFASSGSVATSRSASRAILALNAASNFLRDLVISVLHRLRQSRTLHTLTFGPISGVHFTAQRHGLAICIVLIPPSHRQRLRIPPLPSRWLFRPSERRATKASRSEESIRNQLHCQLRSTPTLASTTGL